MRNILLVLSVFVWLSPVYAADKVAKIRELLTAQHSEAMMERLRLENVEQVRVAMYTQAGDQASNPIMVRLLERAVAKYAEYSKELFDWKKSEKELIAFYDAYFTTAQLDAILAFFKSEAGQALLKAQPQLLSRMQRSAFQGEADRSARVERIMKETIAEIEEEVRKENAKPE